MYSQNHIRITFGSRPPACARAVDWEARRPCGLGGRALELHCSTLAAGPAPLLMTPPPVASLRQERGDHVRSREERKEDERATGGALK